MVERHRVLDVTVVDNILDMAYLSSALPKIAQAGYDLRLHYEIKSNLRREQLQTLLEAGVMHVQPGIESLSSRVLRIMKKGVTGCQNVRMLRDVESLCMQAEWNYLCGFPGESENDYAPVIRQFPALHHLRPPSASRIVIERFSPYHSGAEPGFPDLRAADQYRITYDLPEPELMDLAYLFTAAPQGVDDTVIDQLRQEADAWTAAYYAGSRFTYCDLGDEVVLVNTRPGFGWRALSVAPRSR